MKIGVIGWGSLIWNPMEISFALTSWNNDGPILPIEFARRSQDGRVTLVIHKPYIHEPEKWVRTYWNIISVKSIGEAIEILRRREGTIKCYIAHLLPDSKNTINDKIKIEIEKWVQDKELDGVIWTDLPSNIALEEVIPYLQSLQGNTLKKAKEYVERTPKQILTPLRKRIEKILGWKCISEV